MRQTFSASLFSNRPTGNPRYRPGDIVATTKKATGTHSRPNDGELMEPIVIAPGSRGTISEIAPFRPREEYPPGWIYRVRFPRTGETRYWIRGSHLRLVERNPKMTKTKCRKR